MKRQFQCEYKEEVVEVTKKYVDIVYKNEVVDTIDLDQIKKKKNIKISSEQFKEKNKIVNITEIDGKRIYVYLSKNGNLYVTNNINKFYKVDQHLKCKLTKKYLYFLWHKYIHFQLKIVLRC